MSTIQSVGADSFEIVNPDDEIFGCASTLSLREPLESANKFTFAQSGEAQFPKVSWDVQVLYSSNEVEQSRSFRGSLSSGEGSSKVMQVAKRAIEAAAHEGRYASNLALHQSDEEFVSTEPAYKLPDCVEFSDDDGWVVGYPDSEEESPKHAAEGNEVGCKKNYEPIKDIEKQTSETPLSSGRRSEGSLEEAYVLKTLLSLKAFLAIIVVAAISGFFPPKRFFYEIGHGNPSDGNWTIEVFTGDTSAGVVFVRPDSGGVNGVPPPTTLSVFADQVPYEAVYFKVTKAGVYTIKSTPVAPSGWDNFVLLYRGSFAPSTPLVNLIASNDDGPGGSGTTQVSLSLRVGVYVFVTTGFENDKLGTYKIFSGGPAKLQLLTYVYDISTVGGNTFPRVRGLTAGSVQMNVQVPFNSFAFNVSTTGAYEIRSSAIDPLDYEHLSLVYNLPVNPRTPVNGLIAQNDDFGSNFVRVTLQAGTVYYIVTTSFNPDADGVVKYRISGPGTVTALRLIM